MIKYNKENILKKWTKYSFNQLKKVKIKIINKIKKITKNNINSRNKWEYNN